MTVSVNDLVRRDYYEIWKRLVTKQNSNPAVLEQHTKLRNDKREKTQATQGIYKSSIVQEAKRVKEETANKQNPYSVQAVPKWDTGILSDAIMKSLGMYPEPPLRADPEQRPGGMQNPGLKKIRAAAHGYYTKMPDSPKENGYLRWLLKLRSMTMDEMMSGEFDAALASLGMIWTEDRLIKVYDEQKKVLVQDVLAQLRKLITCNGKP